MKKKNWFLFIFLVLIISIGCKEDEGIIGEQIPVPDPNEMLSGGATTILLSSSQSFSMPAPNLSASILENHLEGDINFEQNFVKAPAPVNSGLGPLFNNVSCINCHVSDGRGRPPLGSEDLESMLIRISVPGIGEHGGPNPVPGFGAQLQDKAIFGYEPEGDIIILYEEVEGTYPDGTKYYLRKPNYQFTGKIGQDVLFSPRVAPAVFGLGLIEAIEEEDILFHSDELDIDGDGISGKPNYVWDVQSKSLVLGRFGWKANTPNLVQQSAAAYVNDMGITNPLFPNENSSGDENNDGLNDDPEISMEILESVALYCQTLAVPGRRNYDDAEVLHGKKLFNEVGCVNCHVAEYTTGYHKISEVSNQKIFPYTDLLLHDMGDDLADNRPDFDANGNEWRTQPLWGLGLIGVVNGHTNLLHDGRARTIEEAILWHGGEAKEVKDNFMALSKVEREKVISFLNSL